MPDVGGEGPGANEPGGEPPHDTDFRGSCSSGECAEHDAGETVHGAHEEDDPDPAARA